MVGKHTTYIFMVMTGGWCKWHCFNHIIMEVWPCMTHDECDLTTKNGQLPFLKSRNPTAPSPAETSASPRAPGRPGKKYDQRVFSTRQSTRSTWEIPQMLFFFGNIFANHWWIGSFLFLVNIFAKFCKSLVNRQNIRVNDGLWILKYVTIC